MEVAAVHPGVSGVAPGEHIEGEVVGTEKGIVVGNRHVAHRTHHLVIVLEIGVDVKMRTS